MCRGSVLSVACRTATCQLLQHDSLRRRRQKVDRKARKAGRGRTPRPQSAQSRTMDREGPQRAQSRTERTQRPAKGAKPDGREGRATKGAKAGGSTAKARKGRKAGRIERKGPQSATKPGRIERKAR